MERWISLSGLVVLLFLCWLMSSHRRCIPWRIVIAGTLLQFAFAVFILRTAPGLWLFQRIGDFFSALTGFVHDGSVFVFGPKYEDFYFAFKVLPTIIFFSSLMSVLYYLGIMQRAVQAMAWLMQWTLGTSGAETISASANVFLGQTEAPLLIRPYVPSMTVSELNAVMVGGFATISGGVMAAFVEMGIDAGHLVSASVISAPAGLVAAKLVCPEREQPVTKGRVGLFVPSEGVNVIEAAATGASEGLKLALNVAAMLLAFLALIAMMDKSVAVVGGWFGQTWSLQAGLGYAFAPVAWLMGVEPADCLRSGQLLGLKMAANEFIAYQELSTWLKPGSGVSLSPRTVTILTYALCGFSNFSSIGIQLGGLGGMAPERRSDLARLGLRAMIAGTLACCMTACVAGALVESR